MDNDAEIIAAVLSGAMERFEVLVVKYQPRVFATARRYARRENEVEDIVQEVFIKAYQKLGSYRGDAPFEHWLMRLAVHTCYDHLRGHQRNKEDVLTDLTQDEVAWLERFATDPATASADDSGARELLERALGQLSAPARMVITMLEIEDRSVKEIAERTGWSMSLVKVRAFRARNELRKIVERLLKQGNL